MNHRRGEVQAIIESEAFCLRFGARMRAELSDLQFSVLALLAQSASDDEALARITRTMLGPHIDRVVEEIRSERATRDRGDERRD